MPNYGDPSDRTQPTGPQPPDIERPTEPERPETDIERPSYRDDVDHPGARNERDDFGLGEGPENAGVGAPAGSLRGEMDERDDVDEQTGERRGRIELGRRRVEVERVAGDRDPRRVEDPRQ